MNYPTSNTQDLIQQNQNYYEEIVSYKLYRSLGLGKSLWFFFIKGYEIHFRLTGYWLEKLVYIAGYKWNGSHLDYSSNLLTFSLPSYRLFNTGAELILLKHESLFCISHIYLRINEGSYNGLQHLYWLRIWRKMVAKLN